MARFTTLSDAELATIAARFDLGGVEAHTPLDAGTINTNVAVTTARGRYLVRINEGKVEADVAWEAALVVDLAAGGLPTPVPVAADDGLRYAALGPRWISVFPWVEGVHRGAGEVAVADAHALGRALAQLHALGDALPPTRLRADRYDDAELVRRRARIAGAGRPELAAIADVLEREAEALRGLAEVRAGARRGLIHGDLFRDNVLWQVGARARLAALLDFEQASVGSHAYDLAVCMNDWCWREGADAGPRADLARALVGGYQTVRPLADADRAALAVELRAAAARFTTTRITDVYLGGIDNPDKDFRAYADRLAGWQAGLLGPVLATV
ncbi:MAG: homoserine kinase [Kofleriaceae bacterium]